MFFWTLGTALELSGPLQYMDGPIRDTIIYITVQNSSTVPSGDKEYKLVRHSPTHTDEHFMGYILARPLDLEMRTKLP